MATAEQVLADMAEQYKNAPRILSWQPPDGDYLDLIINIQFGFFFVKSGQKPKPENAGVQIIGRIVDGPYQNQKHVLGTFTERSFGFMAEVVERLGGGDSMPDAVAAGKWLQGNALNRVVQDVVSTRFDQQGNERRNCQIEGFADVPTEAFTDAPATAE